MTEKTEDASSGSKIKMRRDRRRLYDPIKKDREMKDRSVSGNRMITKEEEAKLVINKYLAGSILAGTIPVPVLDIATVTGIQLKMLHSISKLYGVPFSENVGKSIIASLIGGLGSISIGMGIFGSVVKVIPVVGPLVGPVIMPVTAGAFTYAVGKVFVQHFEAGGTFLDFDPEKTKDYFTRLYQEGKKVSSEVSKTRRIKPEVEVRPAEGAVQEVEPEEAVKEEEGGLKGRVLAFIESHPEGVRVGAMEGPLGLSRMRLGQIAKRLLNDGKVRREGPMYFPL